MNKEEFIAESIASKLSWSRRKTPELRAAAATQAEAAWVEYNSPNNVILRYLESKGLELWISTDGTKRRVYFKWAEANAPYSTICYFDQLAGTWHEEKGALLDAAAKANVFKKIEALKSR